MSTTAAVEQIAKVRSVRLGREDHGIFTCMVDLDYGCSGHSAGGYALDEPRRDEDDKFIGRYGTAYGMQWIIRLMEAAGVEWFHQIQGRTLIAVRGEGHNGPVLGLKPLPTEPGKPFMFDELAA